MVYQYMEIFSVLCLLFFGLIGGGQETNILDAKIVANATHEQRGQDGECIDQSCEQGGFFNGQLHHNAKIHRLCEFSNGLGYTVKHTTNVCHGMTYSNEYSAYPQQNANHHVWHLRQQH